MMSAAMRAEFDGAGAETAAAPSPVAEEAAAVGGAPARGGRMLRFLGRIVHPVAWRWRDYDNEPLLRHIDVLRGEVQALSQQMRDMERRLAAQIRAARPDADD